MTRDAQTAFARTLVDEWARNGVRHACVAPGSRSTPLALALADDPSITIHVHIDERSAAFFALGIGKATGIPAVALCTSGTAAAHFHAAVLEAHHARVPLLVCTADRPPELRDTGAGQTIDQAHLYGGAVRWYCDPGPAEDRAAVGAFWRQLACRAIAEAVGPPAGPVHLNLPFREPLVPTGAPLVDAPGRPGGGPWTVTRRSEPSAVSLECPPRTLVIAGGGAPPTDPAGFPLLADPISNLRTGEAISAYEALVRVPGFADAHRPDAVVRLGAPLTSKTVMEWLGDSVRQIAAEPGWLDPMHASMERVPGPVRLAGTPDLEWCASWHDAESRARAAIDTLLDGDGEPFEGRVARDVAGALPDGAVLVVGSSMPVRDLEWFMRPRGGLRVLANRGVNGIDGFASTALGIAASGAGAPVVGLTGDLGFLHDVNGLLGAARRGIEATFVVLDNGGGGIFSFLPQADAVDAARFEELFATPHGLDLVELCELHGIGATRVARAEEVVPAVLGAVRVGGVGAVVVPIDRSANVARHRVIWEAVRGTLRR